MKNIGLLLIDIQNDYFPGGKMEVTGSEKVAINAIKLLDYFRSEGIPVFHIQHISINHRANFFLPQTIGVEIHKSMCPIENEILIQKHFPNCFRETNILKQLKNLKINRLVIAGMMTQMCIDSSVRAAYDYGFECFVSQNACAAHELRINNQIISAKDVHAAFLAAIHGTYGRVMETDKLILRLQKRK